MALLVLALLFPSLTLSGSAQNDCNCPRVLEKLVVKVETEYPGFRDVVKDRPAYERFKAQIMESARRAAPDACLNILQEYLQYFKNSGHLQLLKRETGPPGAEGTKQTLEIDIDAFIKRLERNRDALEGIWSASGYRVGLVKRDSEWIAFIISSPNENWKAGDIKFRLKAGGQATYMMRDHSARQDAYLVDADSLIHFSGSQASFVRERPASALTPEQIDDKLNEIEGFTLRPVGARTLLVKIPSFEYAYTSRIERLIKNGDALLKRFDNLIIDLRGNSGGATASYRPLLPYLYTNPVRHLGGEYLVTRTLIDSLKNWVENADRIKDAGEIKAVQDDIQRMEGKTGLFIPYDADGEMISYSRQEAVLPCPKNVVILVDHESGSATEQFLLTAKQSRKVKVFGTPTFGAIDYLSVLEFSLDCEEYTLYMPTVRDARVSDYPLDMIGVQPDVYLDKYVQDWIAYALEYLERQ